MQEEHTVNVGKHPDEGPEHRAERERQFQGLHFVGLYFRNILEMTGLWKRLPGRGWEQEGT